MVQIGAATKRYMLNWTYLKLMIAIDEGISEYRKIAKNTGMTYHHLTNVVRELLKEGIVVREDEITPYQISLTNKGRALVAEFRKIRTIVEHWPEDE